MGTSGRLSPAMLRSTPCAEYKGASGRSMCFSSSERPYIHPRYALTFVLFDRRSYHPCAVIISLRTADVTLGVRSSCYSEVPPILYIYRCTHEGQSTARHMLRYTSTKPATSLLTAASNPFMIVWQRNIIDNYVCIRGLSMGTCYYIHTHRSIDIAYVR